MTMNPFPVPDGRSEVREVKPITMPIKPISEINKLIK
jgi:hypothetical protein